MIALSGSKASLSAVEQARVFSDLLDERQAQTTVSDRSVCACFMTGYR